MPEVPCTNCGGAGRTIYQDPETGQDKDAGACQACGGSGVRTV